MTYRVTNGSQSMPSAEVSDCRTRKLTEQERKRGRAERRKRQYHPRPILFIYSKSKSSDNKSIYCLPPTMAPVAASPTPIVEPLPVVPPTTAPKDKKAAARKRFEAVYTVVRDDLLADFRKHNMPEDAIGYYRRVRTPTTFSSYMMFLITP